MFFQEYLTDDTKTAPDVGNVSKLFLAVILNSEKLRREDNKNKKYKKKPSNFLL